MTTLYNKYYRGAGITLGVTFTDADDNPADPTDVTFSMKDPVTGDITDYITVELTHDDTGVFSIDIDTTDFNEGTWYYKWVGTGALVAASEWAFIINHENVV